MIQIISDNKSSIDNQIQSLINKLNSYQLEILSFCTKNNLPTFNFIRLTNFDMYHSEIIFKELGKLGRNITFFINILTNQLLYRSFLNNFNIYTVPMFKIIAKLSTLIDFYQNHTIFLMTREKNLESFNLNLIYKQSSFPNTFQKDNHNFLAKLTNMPFETNKYLISISQFYKSSNFLIPLKSKDDYFIYQKNDTVGFKNNKFVFYANSKEEFLNKLFSTISKLDNKKYSFMDQKFKIISILIYSSHNTLDDLDPPVSNDELFRKVA
jgi:hypothetical protein